MDQNETQKATMYEGTGQTPDYVCFAKAGNILLLVKPMIAKKSHTENVAVLRVRAHTDNGMPMPNPEAGLFQNTLPWQRMDSTRFAFDTGVLEFPSVLFTEEAKAKLTDSLTQTLLSIRQELMNRITVPAPVENEGLLPVEYLVDYFLNHVQLTTVDGGANVIALGIPAGASEATYKDLTLNDLDEEEDEDEEEEGEEEMGHPLDATPESGQLDDHEGDH